MKSEYAETSKTININDINKHVDINPYMIPVQKQYTSININKHQSAIHPARAMPRVALQGE
jgi:hypothetical protein